MSSCPAPFQSLCFLKFKELGQRVYCSAKLSGEQGSISLALAKGSVSTSSEGEEEPSASMERERDSEILTDETPGVISPTCLLWDPKQMHAPPRSLGFPKLKKMETPEVSVGAATGMHMTRQVVPLTSQQALKPGLLWQRN